MMLPQGYQHIVLVSNVESKTIAEFYKLLKEIKIVYK